MIPALATCPSCGARTDGRPACSGCGRLLEPARVEPVVPLPRLFRMETTAQGVRFVGRVQLVIVIVILIVFPPIGLLLAFARTEVRIEGDAVEVRSFAMPTSRTGRFPLHTVADAAWTAQPAKNGGYTYKASLVLTDGATIELGFSAAGQPEVLHIANALRGALAAQKRT
jgi:hypothetical protein